MGVKRKKSGGHDEATSSSPTARPADVKSKVHHPHDTFVKAAFEPPPIAVDFFAAHLKDKNLSKEELATFELSPNEHQKTVGHSIANDIVYRGHVKNRTCFIIIEHQSSLDRTMPLRFAEYSTALIREHIAQGHSDDPVIWPICLYHDTAACRKKNNGRPLPWKDPPLLAGSSLGQEACMQSALNLEYKLVDLTTMSDTEISTHKKAAIVEWILKHASVPNDEFLRQAKELIEHMLHSTAETGTPDISKAIGEYILAMYEDTKTRDVVMNELCELMPQEREAMGKLFDEARAEGKVEGKIEECESLLKLIQSEPYDAAKLSNLLKEEIAQLSLNKTESTPPSRTAEATLNPDLIMQGIASLPDPEGSRETHMRTTGDQALETLSPVHKNHMDHR